MMNFPLSKLGAVLLVMRGAARWRRDQLQTPSLTFINEWIPYYLSAPCRYPQSCSSLHYNGNHEELCIVHGPLPKCGKIINLGSVE